MDLQKDELLRNGIHEKHIYEDQVSGKKIERPGLNSCLKSLREGDTLVVWKLDRFGRYLKQLVNMVQDLSERGVG